MINWNKESWFSLVQGIGYETINQYGSFEIKVKPLNTAVRRGFLTTLIIVNVEDFKNGVIVRFKYQ